MPRIGGDPRSQLTEMMLSDGLVAGEDYQIPDTLGLDPILDQGGIAPSPFADLLMDDEYPLVEEEEEDHYANLAEDMPADELKRLGMDLVERVEADMRDREPWVERFRSGLEMLGLVPSDVDDGPFPGASNAVHPLITEAVTQFWARSMGELFPPEGPVKAKILGVQSEERAAAAKRVEEYLNYELTFLDEGYLAETSRLLWQLPIQGSAFRKTYYDPILSRTIGVFVPAEDFIAPADATDLKTTPRFAHRMRKTQSELRRLQLAGYYLDVEIELPDPMAVEDGGIAAMKQDTQDLSPDQDPEDLPYELLEIHAEIDLPGHEHVDDEGEPTGLPLPFVITIEKSSQTVLSIRRGWAEGDEMCCREVAFEKFDFVPGMGFYGYGLFHLIGGLQTAATGALRVLLDGAATASMSGGFVSKHANLKGQHLITEPGLWTKVDATVDDLKKAFFPFPVKEPSPALFQLLGFLVDAAQRFIGTTNVGVGAADPKNAPVGTTAQLIEQGGKVMSTIHRLMHAALGRELRYRKKLAEMHAPAEGYPYDIEGDDRAVYAQDFAMTDIVPVSDPNIHSNYQRLAHAQELFKIATQTGVVPIKKAVRRMLQAMKVSDVDDLVPEDTEPQAYDPSGEIQALLLGKPVRVLPEQPHVAHLAVISSFVQNPAMGGHPMVAQQIGPALGSVAAQHLAYAFATQLRQQGVPAEYMDPETGMLMGQPQAPPEQIAQMMQQIAPAIAQFGGAPTPQQQPDPAAEAKAQEGQMKMQESQARLQLEQQKAQQDAAIKQQDMQLRQEEHQMKLMIEQQKLQADQIKEQLKAEAAEQKAMMDMQREATKLQVEQAKMEMQQQLEAMKAEQQMRQSEQQAAMETSKMAMEAEQEARRFEQQSLMDEASFVQEQDRSERELQMRERESKSKSQLDRLRGGKSDE